MSIRIMSQVWEHSAHSEGTLLVLLALADFANDEGMCFPSQTTLAKKSRLSDRQVRRVLAVLIRSGELSIVRPGRGRRIKTVYRISLKVDNMTTFTKADIGDTKSGHSEPVKVDIAMSCQTVRGIIKESPRRAVARRGSLNPSSDPASGVWIRKQLGVELEEVRAEIESIMRPGGCSYPITPTDPRKKERLEELGARRDSIKRQLAKAI